MLKRIIWCMMIVCMMFVLTDDCAASNILKNADFSEVSEDGIAGWTGDKDTKNRYKLYTVDDALCIENKISNYTKISQNVRVDPNSYYRFSAKVKVLRESNSGGYIEVDILDDAVRSWTVPIIKKSDQWKEVELCGKTDEGQYFVGVSLCLGDKKNEVVGKVLMKDVKLEKINYTPKIYDNWYIDKINSGQGRILIDLVVRTALALFFMLVIYFIAKNINFGTGGTTYYSIKKMDVVVMSVLTLVYLGIALYKLGDTKACQTGWLTSSKDEYVVMKLPRMTHIGKINIFEGQNDIVAGKGKIKLEYLDEELPVDDNDERYHLIERGEFGNHVLREIIEDTKAMTIKLSVIEPGIDIKEIAIYERGSKHPIKGIEILEDNTKGHVAGNLFDEQDLMTYNGSHMNNAIFDEVLYARTGYEYLNNQEGFESTHPPLGKIIMAVGIKIFGMTPFGWRIMSTMFGVLMVPAMYMLGRKFFSNRLYIIACSMLMMFDCMHFTQTRTCLIDSYSVFFIIMTYYYMMDVYGSTKIDRKYVKSMFLSGLFFSLGAATKWIVVYGGVGLALLYFISLYRNFQDNRKDVAKSLLMGVMFFVGMPVIAYLLAYIPVLKATENGYSLAGVLGQVRDMWVFHRDESLAHEFSSRWYEWLINMKPMGFYSKNLGNGMAENVYTIGNPIIWHMSLVAIVVSAIIGYKKKDNRAWVFVLGYLCQYMPWVIITRTTYIYHYFSVIPFAIVAIMYLFEHLSGYKKRDVEVYLVMVVITFFVHYPYIAGLEVNKDMYKVVNTVFSYVIVGYYVLYFSKMLNSKIK